MIDFSRDPGHDQRPIHLSWLLRLLVAAWTVVAIQATLIDPIDVAVLRHLDLPLAVAAVLVLANPTRSTVIGLVFGLAVDAAGYRLFGLHCVAYALLGPIARNLPVPAWRRSRALIAWRAGAQGLGVATVVAIGQAVALGGPAPDALTRVPQVAVLVGLVAAVGGRLLGVDAPLGRRRHRRGRARRHAVGGPRPGPVRPLAS